MRINFMRHKPLPVFVVRSWRMKFYTRARGLENSVQLGEKIHLGHGGARRDAAGYLLAQDTVGDKDMETVSLDADGQGLVGGGGQPAQGGEEGVTGTSGLPSGRRANQVPSSIQPGPKPTARRSPLSRRSMASRDGFIITRSWMSRQFSPVSFPSSTVTQVPTTNSWWVFPSMEKEWVNPASPRRTRRPW